MPKLFGVTAPNVVYSKMFDPRGSRVFLRATLLVTATVLGAACTGSGSTAGGATPGGEPGPALDMAVLGEVACPTGVTATACFKVRVTNHWATGGGICTLWAQYTTPNGDDSEAGPRLHVNNLASGATITETLAWKNDLPIETDLYFRGICDPGLRS